MKKPVMKKKIRLWQGLEKTVIAKGAQEEIRRLELAYRRKRSGRRHDPR